MDAAANLRRRASSGSSMHSMHELHPASFARSIFAAPGARGLRISHLLSADFRSAPVPPPGPGDHVRGESDAPLVIEYGDYECPYCAKTDALLVGVRVRRVFRHFPVVSK